MKKIGLKAVFMNDHLSNLFIRSLTKISITMMIGSVIGLFSTITSSHFASAEETNKDMGILNLSSYLEQVKQKNVGIQASESNMESANLKVDEASLLFAPTAFANLSHIDDDSPITNQATKSEKTTTDMLSVGVQKKFRTGTSASLSYNVNKYHLDNIRSMNLPPELSALSSSTPSEFYVEKPSLEVRQPLWRNSLGKEFRATEDTAKARQEASYYAERAKVRGSLMEAEMAYWKLSFAKAVVRIQIESLQRFQKIREWTSTRVSRQLADKADLIQAEAMVNLRTLELKSAEDEVRIASQNFNSLRGIDSDTVSESILPFNGGIVQSLKLPNRTNERDDVKAIRASALALSANAISTEEKYKPSLEAFGIYSINGKHENSSKVYKESTTADQPTWTVGLTFSTPLDFDTIKRTNQGYRLESKAAEESYQRKIFEQNREWQNLIKKFEEAKRRLELADGIEKVQKTKLDYERERNQIGRSTLYQVLLFEQDFASSQQNKLARINEILLIAAQMKIFSESY